MIEPKFKNINKFYVGQVFRSFFLFQVKLESWILFRLGEVFVIFSADSDNFSIIASIYAMLIITWLL